jgi:hypothetical protein
LKLSGNASFSIGCHNDDTVFGMSKKTTRFCTMIGMKAKMSMACLLLLSLISVSMPASSYAQSYERVYSARAHRYVYVPKRSLGSKIKTGVKSAWRDPMVKQGTIGAGIGLGAAALTEHNLLKGGLVGAGVGAGMGAMDKSQYFREHPLVRRSGKGAMVGAGAAAVTGAAALLPAALVGAGVGAGVHYIKTH